MDTEDRLRTVERQKEDLEHHLLEAALKLQKTPVARFVRFLRGLNPLRSSRERIQRHWKLEVHVADVNFILRLPNRSARIISGIVYGLPLV